jgi:hypothetical protein
MTEPSKSVRIRRIGYSTPTGTPILPVFYDDDMDALPNTDVIDPVLAANTRTPILGYTDGVRTDFTAPQTTIDVANMVSSGTSSFEFSSSEAYSTFLGRIDGAAFAPVTSPKTYAGLVTGGHLFEVYGTDYHGNVDGSPATGSWIITGSI